MRRGKEELEEKRVVGMYSLYGYGKAGRLGGGWPVSRRCKFDISQPHNRLPPGR
jgi:hypothetical protein